MSGARRDMTFPISSGAIQVVLRGSQRPLRALVKIAILGKNHYQVMAQLDEKKAVDELEHNRALARIEETNSVVDLLQRAHFSEDSIRNFVASALGRGFNLELGSTDATRDDLEPRDRTIPLREPLAITA